MSRRLSLQLKNPATKQKPKVKFPDELIFLDSVKDNDIDNVRHMLRRTSLKIDINKINDSGLTPLHQAVLDNSYDVVSLLLENKADVNCVDEDSWTPLHAACSMGHNDVAKYLIENKANPFALTRDAERPLDLVDQSNFSLISLMLNAMREYRKDDSDVEDDIFNSSIESRREILKRKSFIPKDPTAFNEYCKRNLEKILKPNKVVLEEAFSEIKKTFQDDRFLKSKDFICALTNAMIESCLNESDFKLNTELLSKKLPILKKFMGNDTDLELECLYSLQALDFKHDNPLGLLRNLFDAFYYCGSIKKDTFKQWRKNENPYQSEAKHQASLNSLKDFFNF